MEGEKKETKRNLQVELEYPVESLNPNPKYYDLSIYNPLMWKKKENSKHEFGIDLERVIPKEGEVRLLGNKHRDCRYYTLGKCFIHLCQGLRCANKGLFKLTIQIFYHVRL